jgi:hypothetical protein
MGKLSLWTFGISPEETSFERRGFRCDEPEIRVWLERVGIAFVAGYRAGLLEDRAEPLAARLESEIEPSHLGFAFEGAGMALALLDAVTPWRRDRLRRFVEGPAEPHVYLVYVGVGFALARLPLSYRAALARLDPLLGWLAIDGYGFHEGFFHWPRTVDRQEVPRRLEGYARRAFDQGIGRSLWFVEGASVQRIARTIGSFPEERRSDLWGGVGLAATYAGGRDREDLGGLRQAAGPWVGPLAQGAAFAAEARIRAGNPTPTSELASEVLAQMPLAEAAARVHEARGDLRGDEASPAYEVWRQRVQAPFASPTALHPGAQNRDSDTLGFRQQTASA